MSKLSDKAKQVVDFVLALLTVARWLPFLGQWRSLVIALSAVLGTVSGLLVKCDQTEPHTPAKELPPTPQSTPVHTTPSPSPSPTPTATATPKPLPRIWIDRTIVVSNPFTVGYSAPFAYNTSLWADKWRLGTMGKHTDGTHILYGVALNTPGKRRLTVRDKEGMILAEKWIEVIKETN